MLAVPLTLQCALNPCGVCRARRYVGYVGPEDIISRNFSTLWSPGLLDGLFAYQSIPKIQILVYFGRSWDMYICLVYLKDKLFYYHLRTMMLKPWRGTGMLVCSIKLTGWLWKTEHAKDALKLQRFLMAWGRCYDHIFLRLLHNFSKKLALFSENQ
jgi:hypothetical protein